MDGVGGAAEPVLSLAPHTKNKKTFYNMCGIFGVYNHKEAANITYLGLYALQHRGQESVGIAVSNGKEIMTYVGMGLVADVFDRNVLSKLSGEIAIGHVRYSTSGSSELRNAQPITVKCSVGQISIAHNGNLINADRLRKKLESGGSIFQTNSDTEVILHLLAKTSHSASGIVKGLLQVLPQVRGAYSLLILTPESLIAIRDPWGVRPLCIGKLNSSYVISSESCAFDLIGAKFIREIDPGEIIVIDKKGVSNYFIPVERENYAYCIFEFIYFSRPDSKVFGQTVHMVRKRLGHELFKENPIPADMVISIPDSANSVAIGYAEASRIPFDTGLIRNHYVGRTFIEPKQSIRDFGAKIKYNPVKELLNNKRIVVLDDSIVRGTTSRKLIRMLRSAGAKEIHLNISCPPIKHPCFYGIDTPTEKELIASTYSVNEICEFIEADSLHYISLEGMIRATGMNGKDFCLACFTGKYPIGRG